jgi:hypothetical protein
VYEVEIYLTVAKPGRPKVVALSYILCSRGYSSRPAISDHSYGIYKSSTTPSDVACLHMSEMLRGSLFTMQAV